MKSKRAEGGGVLMKVLALGFWTRSGSFRRLPLVRRMGIAIALGFALLSLPGIAPLRAALISHEGFSYSPDTILSGRAGGTGWQGAWVGAGTVVAPGLFRPALISGASRLRTAGSNLGVMRNFTTSGFAALRSGGRFGLDGTELWLSFLIRRDAGFPGNGYGGLSLFNGNTEEIFIGIPTGATNWSFQQFDLGTTPGNITSGTAPIVADETTLLVLRFQFGINGTRDRVELFVDPSPGVIPSAPSATRTGADLQFDRIRLQSGPANAASPVSVDEIRLGESFADVTPFEPGPAVAWLRPGPHRVSAGAEITLPLVHAWPEGDADSLAPVVAAADATLLSADRIVVTGTGLNRRVTFRPPAGAGGATTVTARLTVPGGAEVSAAFELTVLPTPPEGLLVYEPFDYGSAPTSLDGKNGGQGFAGEWSTGIPGTPSDVLFGTGTTNLPFASLATQGTRMRMGGNSAQALKRSLTLPLGEDGTVRYLSLLVRPDNSVTPAGYFGLVALGGAGRDLFVGKPGGGNVTRYVLETAGGTQQVRSAKTVSVGEISLLVLKLEFLPGNDRVSLFVNPTLGIEPGVADAVKGDLDLGLVSTLALSSAATWSADELRLGTTFASVTQTGAEFALTPLGTVEGQEHRPLTRQITTVAPLPAGRTLEFELVGDGIGATLDAVTGEFAWVPGELDGGQLRPFTVRATSDANPPESVEMTFRVQVNEVAESPELTDPGSLLVEEGVPLAFPLVATDPDLPVQVLTFTRISGPEGLEVSPAGLLTWTPSPTQWDDVFEVTVQVRDEFGGVDRGTFVIVTRSKGDVTVPPPPPLMALAAGDEVQLVWENLAGTFALQATSDLASAPWRDFAVTPVLADGLNRVTRPVTNVHEFFRLVSRGGAARLTGATPKPGTLAPGSTRFVQLNFSGLPAPGDQLEVIETTAGLSHERRIPAEVLFQPDGTLGFFLNGDDAPLGTPRVTARLVSSSGEGRGAVTFEVTNLPPDTGGQPPVFGLTFWGPPVGAARRPINTLSTVRPPLFVSLTDPDGDLARLELIFTDPLGDTIHRIMPVVQSGADPVTLTLYPLTFGRDSAVGPWEVQVTAFDASGHAAGPLNARLEYGDTVSANAVVAPLLHSVLPQTGVPGDVVELRVSNVPDLSSTNARVRIGGRPAAVVEAADGVLRVTVPTGTAGGLVEIFAPQGSAIGQVHFVVLSAPRVEPAFAQALAGQTLQFRLDRRLSTNALIAWSVSGGGAIDANGLFRAPDNLSQSGEVVVTATITLPGATNDATAIVTVAPAPTARGSDLIAASTGGEVWSQNLLARVQVPAGALVSDTMLSVSVPAQDAQPPAPVGSELLGLVELGPDDAQFNTTLAVFLPLTRSLPPGESIPLQRWNPAASAWLDDGVLAVVEPDGRSARAEVRHFSLHGLIAPVQSLSPSSRQAAGPGPRITGITPVFIYEGELRPIYLEGSNLDGAVELAVVRGDGSRMSGLVLGPLVRAQGVAGVASQDGTRAAFLLDCPVLPSLGDNQDLELQVRLRKAGHPDALFPLRLRGLPEFNAADLAGSAPPDHRVTRLYSEIVIGTALRPSLDVLDLHATHGIRVLAGLDISGNDGRFGDGNRSGVATTPRRFRTGGQGGNPHGGDAEFLALYEMPARHTRIGYGGATGSGLDDLADLLGVAGCLGADARDCFNGILEDLREDPFDELEDAPADLLNLLTALPDGRRGASGLWNGAPTHWFRIPSGAISDNVTWTRQFGPGSGGGGGGKSGALFGDPGTRLGGGSGGEGGGALRLLSARGLHLGGSVRANGGKGGNGAQRRVDGVVLSAGGGGGGGAGAIRVLAGEAVHIAGGTTEARGGRVGFGGIATRLESVGFGLRAELPYSEEEAPEGMNVIEGSLFDETRLANSVVTLGVITLEPRRAPMLFAFDGRPGLSLDPNRPHVVVSREDGSEPRRCYFFPVGDPARPSFRVNLLLRPGANRVALGGPDERLLDRHIVCLSGPDTDGDGLSDADEVALGTDPAATDTDGDGLGDFEELVNGGNPTRSDSDGDLLPDNLEIALGTLPSQVDSDSDGLWDSLEVYRGQSPTEARSSAFSYTDGELFAIVENEVGERLLALLDPVTGRLGALGRLPGNGGDGITFDPRGTLYLAQGDRLFEWAGSVLSPRGTVPTGPLIGASSGGPGSSGGGVVGFMLGAIPPVPPGAGNAVRDFRTLVSGDGTLKFSKLGDIRSANALGGFTLPVKAGPLTFDPFPGSASRISGVMSTPGVVGQTFHLDKFNQFTPPLVNVILPPAQATAEIKALAFGDPTGHFALMAGAAGGEDFLQAVDPFNGGASGPAYLLGRLDTTALIHVNTNHFILTTATREVLQVELHPVAGNQSSLPLSRTVAVVSRLARVPCVGGCFNPNTITGTGPLGPNFRAQGFTHSDFNGDGFPDLVVAGEDGTEAVVHVLHGDGTGRFNAVRRQVLGEGRIYANGKVALGNLDGDPHRDLAVAWVFSTFFGQQGHLAVLKGTADGRFAAPTDHPLLPAAEGFAIGQFDGVNHDDLVFANGLAFLVPTDAAGTLDFPGSSPLLPTNFETRLVEFSDLDGDGSKDLIRLGEILSVHGGGHLSADRDRNSEFGGGAVMELGDYDGDGKTDLFVSGYSGFVRVFPGNGDLTFDRSLPVVSGEMFGSIPQFAVGDLDGDGRSEIVMPDLFGQRVRILLWNAGDNRYDMFSEFTLATQAFAARIADVNGDRKPDLVLLGVAGSVEVVLGQ